MHSVFSTDYMNVNLDLKMDSLLVLILQVRIELCSVGRTHQNFIKSVTFYGTVNAFNLLSRILILIFVTDE